MMSSHSPRDPDSESELEDQWNSGTESYSPKNHETVGAIDEKSKSEKNKLVFHNVQTDEKPVQFARPIQENFDLSPSQLEAQNPYRIPSFKDIKIPPLRPDSPASWDFNKSCSKIRFKNLNYIYMENISTDADNYFQRASRELCSTIGIFFSLLAFLTVDLLRAFAVKLLRPLLQVVRFIFHMVNSIFCDVIFLAAKGLERSLQPLVDLCSSYSVKVIVPVTSSLVFVRLEPHVHDTQQQIQNV